MTLSLAVGLLWLLALTVTAALLASKFAAATQVQCIAIKICKNCQTAENAHQQITFKFTSQLKQKAAENEEKKKK